MIFEQLTVGAFQCNCFILGCETSREALVIDPGDALPQISARLADQNLTVTAIVTTHAHLDHVGAMSGLAEATGAPTCMHRDDQFLYDHLAMQATAFGLPTPPSGPIERYLSDGDVIQWGAHQAEVLHTPGHTPGSLCFSVPEVDQLFSGDTLFKGSVGRTDLWGGDQPQLLQSIQQRLLPLPDDTTVWPGHGAATQMGLERERNPFLIGLT